MLVILFWRENDNCPAGILPLAFSDIPRVCSGTFSSIEDVIDGVLERRWDLEDWEGVSWVFPSSSESSSPMVNGPLSSGMYDSGEVAPDKVLISSVGESGLFKAS